jgi:hypothetical protein
MGAISMLWHSVFGDSEDADAGKGMGHMMQVGPHGQHACQMAYGGEGPQEWHVGRMHLSAGNVAAPATN